MLLNDMQIQVLSFAPCYSYWLSTAVIGSLILWIISNGLVRFYLHVLSAHPFYCLLDPITTLILIFFMSLSIKITSI